MSLWTAIGASGILTGLGSWSQVGGAAPAILTDGSDATYLKKTSASPADSILIPLTDVTIPTNEAFVSARWRCRFLRPTSTSKLSLSLYGMSASKGTYGGAFPARTVTGPWTSKLDTGLAPTQTELNGINLWIQDLAASAAAATQFMEVAWDVLTASLPQAPVVPGYASPVESSRPPITWTHTDTRSTTVSQRASSGTTRTLTVPSGHAFQAGNDATIAIGNASYDGTYKLTSVTATTLVYTAGSSLTEGTTAASGSAFIGDGAPQAAYQVKIYTATVAGGGGFSPDTTAPLWGSGIVTTTASTVTPGTALPNDNYRAYVRTAKVINGALVWSAWSFGAFTTTGVLGDVTATPSWDSTNQRVQLVVAGKNNLLSAQDTGFENAGDVGGWVANANCTISQSTTFADVGTGSLRLSSSAAGTMSARTASGTAGIPVLPNTAYSAGARVRAGATARTCTLIIQWYDSSGATLTQATGTGVADSTSGFTTIQVSGTSPAGAAYAAVIVQVASTAAAAELHYVDRVSLNPGSSLNYTAGGGVYAVSITRTVGGVTTNVPGPFPLNVAQGGTFYDYLAPRGVSVSYAVTMIGTAAAGSIEATASTAIATSSDGTWWLKSVANPALNRGGVRVLADPSEDIEESLGVFRLEGRTDPVVVGGTINGEDISLDIYTSGAAEYEAIEALARHQGVLLLQEPFTNSSGVGLQRFIRITDRSIRRAGVPQAPRRILSIKGIEVASGV